MVKNKGLDHWLSFIEQAKEWVADRPTKLIGFDLYDVENVGYDDLAALAAHFGAEHLPEDSKHKQSVEVEFSDDFTIKFFSPPRSFSYHDIEG